MKLIALVKKLFLLENRNYDPHDCIKRFGRIPVARK
jgi:hypothetical protein